MFPLFPFFPFMREAGARRLGREAGALLKRPRLVRRLIRAVAGAADGDGEKVRAAVERALRRGDVLTAARQARDATQGVWRCVADSVHAALLALADFLGHERLNELWRLVCRGELKAAARSARSAAREAYKEAEDRDGEYAAAFLEGVADGLER